MAKQVIDLNVVAPGGQGINTEDSPLDQDHTYCLDAVNFVIGDGQRLETRKRFTSVGAIRAVDLVMVNPWPSIPTGQDHYEGGIMHFLEAPAGYTNATRPFLVWLRRIQRDGAGVYVGQTTWSLFLFFDNKYYEIVTSGFEATIDAGAFNTTWEVMQIVELSDSVLIFTNDNAFHWVYNLDDIQAAASGTARLAAINRAREWDQFNPLIPVLPPIDDSGVLVPSSAILTCQHVLSAYGRLWVAGWGSFPNQPRQDQRIYWSNLLSPFEFFDGRATPANPTNTAGFIDVSEYWPNNQDRIMAVAAHNNFLIVFGRRSILVFGNPQGDPAAIGGIYLADAIEGIGLVSRHAITNTGTDLLFVDDTGVRSLARTIQEQSAAIGDLTRNVRGDVIRKIANYDVKDEISLTYCHEYGFTLLFFPASRDAYVLDTRRITSSGGAAITRWDRLPFNFIISDVSNTGDYSLFSSPDGEEVDGSGVASFNAVLAYDGPFAGGDGSELVYYQSRYITGGDTSIIKVPKKLSFTTVQPNAGGLTYDVALAITREATSTGTKTQTNSVDFNSPPELFTSTMNTRGSGRLFYITYSSERSNFGVLNNTISLQEFRLQLVTGRNT